MVDVVEVLRRWDAGASKSEIADRLGLDRKTVRKYVSPAEEAGLAPGGGRSAEEWAELAAGWFPGLADFRLRQTTWPGFDEHEGHVRGQLTAGATQTVVWQRLRDEKGVEGSLRSFNRWCRHVFGADLARARATAWMPDTPPGEVAQVDYGLLGRWADPDTGARPAVQAFIMTLRCSRMLFVWPTPRMDQAAWQQAHVAAFEFFGGVPKRVVLDNLKTGVARADLWDPTLNRSYRELSCHYGFTADPARPGRPKDKATVERMVQYVRGSFWTGREFSSIAEMRAEAVRWRLGPSADRRLRAMPDGSVGEVFRATERPALLALPPKPFEVVEWTTGKVAPDCHVSVKACLYSVPHRLIGQRLDVKLTATHVVFHWRGEPVKAHVRQYGRGRRTDPDDYPPRQAAWLHKDAAWVRARAEQIGPACLAAVEHLMRHNALAAFRSCVGVVGLADRRPAAAVDRACAQAAAVGDVAYRTIRNLTLIDGADTPPRPQGDNGAGALLRGPAAFDNTQPPLPGRADDTSENNI